MTPTYRKKLIEVALPLEEINIAAAREKSIRHGHPSTLHLWWARRPLASCRAVLFASIIDDPDQDGVPQPLLDRIDTLPLDLKYRPAIAEAKIAAGDEAAHDAQVMERRYKLFTFIEQLVQWANSNDADTLQTAQELIHAATNGNPPPVLDPFAGGGSIPLEAQRLGLEAHASDLNPVAVLINKAQIEIPPKFAGQPPVNPDARSANKELKSWTGAQGLADDVRYYGKWMRDEAEKRIGHLYPKAQLPNAYGGGEATVIAWIWARTVASPNPQARGAHVPLVRSFALSTKAGKEAWVEPVVDTETMTYRFVVRTKADTPHGKPREATIGKRGGTCLLTNAPMDLKYVRAEAQAGRMGARLMAVVAEGQRGRIYLAPTDEQEQIAFSAVPTWKPDGLLPKNPRDFKTPLYGMTMWADLFTARQLTALSTFAELVGEARQKVASDVQSANGSDPHEYADAVATYLGFGVSRMADINNCLCMWENTKTQVRHLFTKQSISMMWDFAENNVFNMAAGDFVISLGSLLKVLERFPCVSASLPFLERRRRVKQQDALEHGDDGKKYLIATDPPYYDNISYAALSDFFYVWLRHTLADIYPQLFGTIATPKTAELIADPYRHGGKDGAKKHFEDGMRHLFRRICETASREYPVTIVYAFKQSETESGDDGEADNGNATATASTGWETFLSALVEEGFQVTGTWPMRTEMANRMIGAGSNALASSIALVCRPRPDTAKTITRREFQSLLRSEVALSIRALQSGNIAPVDLQQSAIGPGMAVFSRFAQVLEASGKPMTVRTALQDINRTLDAVIESGDFDSATNWAIAWFGQYAFNEAPYGSAETLATAKAVSISGLVADGIIKSGGGKAKLLSRDELSGDYDPRKDDRVTVWEATQYLTRALDKHGTLVAGQVLRAFREAHPDLEIERARDLAYRLFALCDTKKWAGEARPYNALVLSWGDIEIASQEKGLDTVIEGGLFADGLE